MFAFLIPGFLLFAFACNNSPSEKEEKKADTPAAAPAPAAEVAKPAFVPFDVMTVTHHVKDFAKWKVGFLAHDSARKAADLTSMGLGRGLEASNLVLVVNKIGDLQKAKTFAASPNLKEVMKKAGVTGIPEIEYLHVIRNDDSQIEFKDRLMVAHHVKNFDAWVKVFDGEGPATRSANGLIDRGLARGIQDSNMVYVLFAVSDQVKAKARSTSPELKKIMAEAGVDSKPKISMFKLVD